MSEIEPPRDAELWAKYGPDRELAESLLGPVGALVQYARKRIAITLAAASQRGAPVDQLSEAIDGRPALGALVVNALEATRRSPIDAKAHAFGRAIAAGLLAADDATIDAQRQIVRTIDVLEMPHITAIEAVRADPERPAVTVIAEALGHTPVAIVIYQVVVREALLESRGTTFNGQAEHCGLSAYGELVRRYLIDAAE